LLPILQKQTWEPPQKKDDNVRTFLEAISDIVIPQGPAPMSNQRFHASMAAQGANHEKYRYEG